MKKLILASAIAAAFTGSLAHAEEAASEHVVTYNLGVTSDYVFRGISQSRNKPAVSGGMDYTNTSTGLYAGTWASTISWVNDSTTGGFGNTNFELDLYGGKRGEVGGGLSYDVGGIYYYYPNEKINGTFKTNTFEAYGQLGYGPVYFKVNYGLTDVVATGAAGTYYLDGGANIPVADGLTLNLHYGYFSFKDNKTANYKDWKVGITKDFGGLVAAIAATGTDADKTAWNLNSTGYLGDTKFIASLTKNF